MIRRPTLSTRSEPSLPTRRVSDLDAERPASSTAVMMMLNSRSIAMPINSTAKTSAPNCRNMLAPNRPTTAPMKKEVRATIGMASSRSEEHTSELQSLMRNSYAVLCLKNKNPTSDKQNQELQ